MAKQKSAILLLRCGHVKFLREPIEEEECFDCPAGGVIGGSDSPFVLGYKAGLTVQTGMDWEGMQRLAAAWLASTNCREGCQCKPCVCSRKILRARKG
jgi:hypothetical protein